MDHHPNHGRTETCARPVASAELSGGMTSALLAVSMAVASPATEFASFHPVPVVIAHRGASVLAPENTIAAIRAAESVGAKAIEFDIHQTFDGRLVLLHDFTLARTTSGTGRIADKGWSYVQGLDAGAWFSPRFSGENVPLLVDALDVFGKETIAAIEIKPKAKVLPKLPAILREAGMLQRSLIFSFHAKQIRAARQHLPSVPALLLIEPAENRSTYNSSIFNRARTAGANLIGLNHTAVTPDIVAQAHQHGLPVFVYTVDETTDVHRMLEAGVDGIISNRPRATMNRVEQWRLSLEKQQRTGADQGR